MKPEDVEKCLKNHYACFPGVGKFVRQEKNTHQVWGEIIEDIPELRHALKVSGMMLRKDLPNPPYGEHPSYILREAKNLASAEFAAKRSADEQSTRHHGEACGLCRGTGTISVWDYGSHKRMRDGTFWETVTTHRNGVDYVRPRHTRYRQSAGCKCAKGDFARRLVKRKGVEREWCATYDENNHVICKDTDDAESIQALQDFESVADTVEAGDGVKGQQWEF